MMYVRPLLEYAVPFWAPISKSLTMRLEAVLRKFSKIVFNRLHFEYRDYSERLRSLSMDSFEIRKMKLELGFHYKILHSSDNPVLSLLPPVSSSSTRYAGNNFILPFVRSTVRKNFFTFRAPSIWNSADFPSLSNLSSSVQTFITILRSWKGRSWKALALSATEHWINK